MSKFLFHFTELDSLSALKYSERDEKVFDTSLHNLWNLLWLRLRTLFGRALIFLTPKREKLFLFLFSQQQGMFTCCGGLESASHELMECLLQKDNRRNLSEALQRRNLESRKANFAHDKETIEVYTKLDLHIWCRWARTK